MKRQKADTESLVYAYGCGQPTVGWAEAEAENERAGILWDRLVMIERQYDADVLAAAGADMPRIAELAALVAQHEHDLRIARGDKERRALIFAALRELRGELWPALTLWRKSHVDVLRGLEDVRRGRVVEARHATDAWWPNYNAVIQRYETARVEVRKRGRHLRLRDITRDDGCLTVQIQRTRSGLGAAPAELQDGTVSMLAIGRVPDAAYDPLAGFRGDRRRQMQTVVEMRVDTAGSTVRLPVWMHRPLPPDCRVKSAQLVWTPVDGGRRMTYGLRLTISQRARAIAHPAHASARVRIQIAEHGRGLRVATIERWGSDISGIAHIDLDAHWCSMMDRVEHLASIVADASASDAARIRARMESPGLRARLIRRRREVYRLAARDIARDHARIVVETPPLAEVAYTERGSGINALRHRACAHALIAELRHQARKHGCAIDVVIAASDASAKVPKRVRVRRNNDLQQSTGAQIGALANVHATA